MRREKDHGGRHSSNTAAVAVGVEEKSEDRNKVSIKNFSFYYFGKHTKYNEKLFLIKGKGGRNSVYIEFQGNLTT